MYNKEYVNMIKEYNDNMNKDIEKLYIQLNNYRHQLEEGKIEATAEKVTNIILGELQEMREKYGIPLL